MKLKHLVRAPIVAGLNLVGGHGDPQWPRYIRTTDITGPDSLGSDVVSIAPEKVGRLNVVSNDLLFTRTGSLGTVYFHRSPESAAFAGYLVRVRPDDAQIDPRWLWYWAQSSACREQIQMGAIRSTIDNFNATKIANLTVPKVDLVTSKEIADFLDLECARIDELQREFEAAAACARQSQTETLRRLILDDDVPRVPVKFYARTGTGHTPSRAHPEYWIEEDRLVPWFTLADVGQIRDGRREVVTETAERATYIGIENSAAVVHPAGTVFLSRTASVGFSAIMGEDMAVSQDFMTWTCGPKLEPRYLVWTLRAMQPELRGLMYGSTHKTIYMPDLLALRIPLPSVRRQREIVDIVTRVAASTWPLVDELAATTASLSEYRDALITEAVTGKLPVAA